MKKRICLLSLLSLSLFLLCSCAIQVQSTGNVALPNLTQPYSAPTEDQMTYQRLSPLYLPSTDGQSLISRYEPIPFTYGTPGAATLLRALFALPSDYATSSLSNIAPFELYGPTSVVISGGICSINLTQSALQADLNQLYNAAMAMTGTLCETNDIHHVQLLITDQAPGMDISGNLPLGLLSARPGETLSSMWESFISRRTPLGSEPSQAPINATCALYFPVDGQGGVIPQVRSISFSGQTPQQLVAGLLETLSGGSQYLSGTVTMPNILSLMSESPAASDMLQGGRLISLRFKPDLREQLSQQGITLTDFASSLVLTITSFVPSVSAVRWYIGDEILSSLEGRTFRDGMMRRTDFASNQLEQASMYFAKKGGLTRVTHFFSASTAISPRRVLFSMMQGPTSSEKNAGVSPVLPGGLNDSDILGMQKQGDCLLINLSANFESGIRALYPEQEKLCCYALVNTLCETLDVRRVVFFFQGQSLTDSSGVIDWSGQFIMNPAIIADDRG